MASRRAPVFGVSFLVQVIGVVLAGAAALVAGETIPTPGVAVIAAAAGVVGVIGIIGLYQGLAVGRMGVVAPVTGVLAASLPVVVGIATEGVPAVSVLVGIGFALVSVVLVSRAPGHDDRPSGIEFALLAGGGIGVFNVLIGQLPEGQVFGPLAVLKLTAGLVIAAVVLLGRRRWRVPRPTVPLALGVGLADMAGNALFVLASQAGRLDIAATLSSLYPVTTVVLAIALTGERIGRSHLFGIATAAIAIALISAGTAA